MRRREFLALVGGLAAMWPLTAGGQSTTKPKLGVLLVGNREPFLTEFSAGLRDVGYVAGEHVELVVRTAEGRIGALSELAADLVRLKVNIIVASETPAVQAAKRATSEIPIVMAPSGDPVGTGLISSLSRPGGNVTGLSAATAELAGKSLELIREMLPGAKRVAALADPSNSFTKPFLEQINLVAPGLNLDVDVVMMRSPDEFHAAFVNMLEKRPEAAVVQPTLPRQPIVKLVQQHKLPSVSGNRAYPEAGGLMSYAGSLADRYRKAAPYVDRILRGAKPADLPVQQPTKFELVINLKAAKALGITVPATMLGRADEVIE